MTHTASLTRTTRTRCFLGTLLGLAKMTLRPLWFFLIAHNSPFQQIMVAATPESQLDITGQGACTVEWALSSSGRSRITPICPNWQTTALETFTASVTTDCTHFLTRFRPTSAKLRRTVLFSESVQTKLTIFQSPPSWLSLALLSLSRMSRPHGQPLLLFSASANLVASWSEAVANLFLIINRFLCLFGMLFQRKIRFVPPRLLVLKTYLLDYLLFKLQEHSLSVGPLFFDLGDSSCNNPHSFSSPGLSTPTSLAHPASL